MKKAIFNSAVVFVAVLAMVGLVACGGASPATVKAKLESAGYTVAMVENDGNAVLTAGLSGGAFYSKNKDERESKKSSVTSTLFTIKTKGNWVYWGNADFITAIEKIL